MYTAIALFVDLGSGSNVMFSRHVSTTDLGDVTKHMLSESGMEIENLDTILILQNGDPGPGVVKTFSAENGDFE